MTHRPLACAVHSEVPHKYGVVIGFFLVVDYRRWRIWQVGIIGYQRCGIGLRLYECACDGTADFIFHDFPTRLRAKKVALPLLPGILAGAS